MNLKLLVIGFVWPEPKSSAAGSRMLHLIEQFQKQGYQITFASAAKMSARSFDLSRIGIESKAIVLNDASFDDFISELNPDAVLFDRFMTEEQYGWRVAEQCPDALRIFDTEDFHGLRKAREVALKQNAEVDLEHLQNETTKREIASIYRCDLSLIISEAEMEILTTQFKIDESLLHYLPFLMEPISEKEITQLPDFESRQHFITIGNFLHAPNFDAVLRLKQIIWPLIRKELPKTELHIYGAYESQKISQLNNEKEGFLIKGFAEDVNAVMQKAKVCLAPLRFGAGLKGKLVDAMQNGTPCMMTNIAAEGMFGVKNDSKNCHAEPVEVQFEVNGFIENNPKQYAKKAIELYTNPKIWKAKQENGFVTINSRFDKTDFESDFKIRIKDLTENLQAYRERNFMGQLLMHHTMQSTKYLSKWIEEKNR